MAEAILGKIIQWGLLLIFLFIVMFAFLNPKFGLMQKIGKASLSFERFLPDSPSKDVAADQSLPKEATSIQQRFLSEISTYSDKSNCLLRFSDLSGLEDTKLELVNFEGKISSRIQKPTGQKLNPIPTGINVQLCKINAEELYNCCLKNNEATDCSKCGSQIYSTISSVLLSNDKIVLSSLKSGEYNYAKGLIFKPTADRTCFIPVYSGWFTKPGCEASGDKLDDDCITDIEIKISNCGESKSCKSPNLCVSAPECSGSVITNEACQNDQVCCAFN
ncbi:MAG TPA: hypothetical protein VJJ52_06005 [Candidatus Nanoarchaeia archaeon]|nr:hypothetical protein [Candidatus Nanoarchaeia archaeon]